MSGDPVFLRALCLNDIYEPMFSVIGKISGGMPERLVPKPGMTYLAIYGDATFCAGGGYFRRKRMRGQDLEYRGGKRKPGEAEEDEAGSEILR